MAKQGYVVISSGPNGVHIHHYPDAGPLLERMNPDRDGFVTLRPEDVFTDWPKQDDPNYWDKKYLILKAELVVPRPKEVVREWEV